MMATPRLGVAALTWILFPVGPATTAFAVPPDFATSARPVLQQHCLSCHGERRHKGGINLSAFVDERSAALYADVSERVIEVVRDGTMPPSDRPAPTADERAALVAAFTAALEAGADADDPGPGPIQRLTRRQYNNTLRDLLGIASRPADRFPADGGGGAGFDNNAATLFVPPILLERYLDAADAAVAEADPGRWRIAAPGPDLSAEEAARRCLERFAARAFRRPVEPDELERLLTLFRTEAATGRDFDSSMRPALRAILVSPSFLYIAEREQPSGGAYPIGPYELASRLSYFLWASMPDDELIALATDGSLLRPEVIAAQARRMLADPRSEEFVADFVGQWLGVASLRHAAGPDPELFPEWDAGLRESMIAEPVAALGDILRNDRSLLELLDSESVYVDERLAKHYGIEGVTGPGFRRVPRLEPGRGGVLGMAGVLTLTSYPRRTSPVLRGKWVLEELLGTPPPPPPPDVGILSEDDRPRKGKTFRQRLEEHRSKPQCAGCHAKLDPLGLGLEGYDPLGRKRDQIGGEPVDDSGVLVSGATFRGPAELKARVGESLRPAFVKNLCRKTLAYALRRGLEPPDARAVDELMTALEREEYRASALVVGVVQSYPFLNRRSAPAEVGAVGGTPP